MKDMKDITKGNEVGIIEITDEEGEKRFYPPNEVFIIANNGRRYKSNNYIKGERKDDDYKHVMKICLPDNKPIRKAINAAEAYVEIKNSKFTNGMKYVFVFLLGMLASFLATFN